MFEGQKANKTPFSSIFFQRGSRAQWVHYSVKPEGQSRGRTQQHCSMWRSWLTHHVIGRVRAKQRRGVRDENRARPAPSQEAPQQRRSLQDRRGCTILSSSPASEAEVLQMLLHFRTLCNRLFGKFHTEGALPGPCTGINISSNVRLSVGSAQPK